MRAFLATCLSVLLLPLWLPVAAAVDDAGSGADAPNSRGMALTVGEGTFSGSGANYDSDWYRVDVPAGKLLGVHYSATGSAWNYLYLYEEQGYSLASVRPGEFGMLQPSNGVALLQTYSSYGAVNYNVTLSFLNAPPQDDGGSGRDAGNTHHSATPVQPGIVRGSVMRQAGDFADWFRVEAAADEIVEVHILGPSYAYVDFHDQEGRYLGSLGGYPAYGVGAAHLAPDGVLLVGVVAASEPYSLKIVILKRADLSLVHVEVSPRSLETELGPLPLSPQRQMQVEVANAGPGAARNARLYVYTTEQGVSTSRRVVADVPFTLAANASRVLLVEWDTLGQAGDVTLHVEVRNEFELAPEDNAATLRTFNVVGGTVVGVDLLNHEVNVAGTRAGFNYGAADDGPFVGNVYL